MSKILVTGGAGFIGSNLVDKLIENGHEVIVIDNLSTGKKDYINEKAKFYEIDICDKGKIDEIFKIEKPDFVFHLAAQIDVRISVADPELDNKINLLGGLNVLKASHENKVEKIIFSSTGGALYGGATEIPTPETYPTYPLSPYGIHKLAFEKYLNYYNKIFGQSFTSLRFSNVYGPRQYKGGEAGVVSIFVDNAVNKKKSIIYGDGLQTRDFVYVDDVVDGFMKAMASDFVGEINISTGIENNLLEVVAAIKSATGEEMEIEFAEARAGEERRSCLSYELAKKILNWEPNVFLDEGIKKTLDWAKRK